MTALIKQTSGSKCFAFCSIAVLLFAPLLLQFSISSFTPGFSLSGNASNESKVRIESPTQALYREQFASSDLVNEVHSATQVKLSNGNMRAFWYGGEREGAKDVSIFTAELNSETNEWLDERVLIERRDMSQQLVIYLRKLGNPVSMRDGEGRIWLFFVSVSVGGWSGSSINFITSDDDGQDWSKPTRLITSPIFNLSTLIKGAPFLYADGSIGLPVYHELTGKFGELLRLSPEGKVLDKQRLTSGRSALQPILLPSNENSAVVYLRNATGAADSTLFETRTADGGQTWSAATLSELPNPNSAIAGVSLSGGKLLLVGNSIHAGRNNLSLLASTNDGQTWHLVHEIEQEKNTVETKYRFSYPALRQSSDGDYHVLYTANRKHIKHVRFNQRWLAERMAAL
jgi:predicted neuraminidase